MKKTFFLFVIMILLFFVGYAQLQTALQKKVTILADDEIVIKTGNASITLKKDGTIIIKGSNIQIEGTNTVTAKASGDVILKGSKVGEN